MWEDPPEKNFTVYFCIYAFDILKAFHFYMSGSLESFPPKKKKAEFIASGVEKIRNSYAEEKQDL